MIQVILSAIGVYIATSLDYLVVLTILFAEMPHKKWHMYVGQYIGTALLVLIGLFATYTTYLVPQDWMIGLWGLAPIYLGIRFFFSEENESEDDFMERFGQTSSTPLYWQVAFFTVASGGDNIGIYIPYFSSFNKTEIFIVLIIFIIGTYLLCRISQSLADMPAISNTIKRYERIIVPVALILLGIYILYENNTIQTFMNLF